MPHITEDEAVFCMAAIGRITDFDPEWYDGDFARNLIEKLIAPMTGSELHWATKLYHTMRFTIKGDSSVAYSEFTR